MFIWKKLQNIIYKNMIKTLSFITILMKHEASEILCTILSLYLFKEN